MKRSKYKYSLPEKYKKSSRNKIARKSKTNREPVKTQNYYKTNAKI